MIGPRLLVDVDALAKLSHWRLASELPSIFGLAPQDICTLPSVLPRASRAATKPDGRLFRTQDAANHLLPLLHQFGALPPANPQYLARFQDYPQIDGGEAVLLAVAMNQDGTSVLTGDKRAAKALAKLPEDLQVLLAGKIVCLEHIVWFLLQRSGLEWLRERICPERNVDKAIAIVMGSQCDAEVEAVEEGLQSYIIELGDSPCFASAVTPAERGRTER